MAVLSAGAIVGIALACALVGAALGFGVCILMYWYNRDEPDKIEECMETVDKRIWNSHYHLEADLYYFYVGINSFVGFFLNHEDAISCDPTPIIAEVGEPEDWARLLGQGGATRRVALNSMICRFLLRRMVPNQHVKTSLLPREILRTFRQGLALTSQIDPKFPTTPPCEKQWRETAVHIARALACYTTTTTDWSNTIQPTDGQKESVAETVEDLVRFLSPFGHTTSDSWTLTGVEGRKHLDELVSSAMEIGIHTFSRVRPIEFFWRSKSYSAVLLRDRVDIGTKDDPYIVMFPGARQRLSIPGWLTNYQPTAKSKLQTEHVISPYVSDVTVSGKRRHTRDPLTIMRKCVRRYIALYPSEQAERDE